MTAPNPMLAWVKAFNASPGGEKLAALSGALRSTAEVYGQKRANQMLEAAIDEVMRPHHKPKGAFYAEQDGAFWNVMSPEGSVVAIFTHLHPEARESAENEADILNHVNDLEATA